MLYQKDWERQIRANDKAREWDRQRTAQQAKIEAIQRRARSGELTGVRLEHEDALAIGKAARQSLSERFNPATTVRTEDGNLWQKGVGGALVPSRPDLLTRDDIEDDQREQQRYAKVSQRLWRAYQVENPYADPDLVRQAASQLFQQSGMSIKELTALADDEMSRPALFDRLNEAVGQAYTASQHSDDSQQDNRTAGFETGGGRSPEHNAKASDDEEPVSLTDMIRNSQKR